MNSAFPILCGVANLWLMMWMGIAEGIRVLPKFMQSMPVAFAFYCLLWTVVIYVFGARFETKTRDRARYAIFAPWGLMLLIVIPQFFSDPKGTAPLLLYACIVLLLFIPGEFIAGWTRR